jgi:mannose-6-phosphate isomerase-like protein (cupin superfamily)
MKHAAINFLQKFDLFDEQWAPKVIAEMNDYQFKIVKLCGDFVWHDHKNTDETFIVIEGDLRIDFRDGAVNISAGEMFVVPKGVEHKPYAKDEVKLLLIEPRGVLNTGEEVNERTAVAQGTCRTGRLGKFRKFRFCWCGRRDSNPHDVAIEGF